MTEYLNENETFLHSDLVVIMVLVTQLHDVRVCVPNHRTHLSLFPNCNFIDNFRLRPQHLQLSVTSSSFVFIHQEFIFLGSGILKMWHMIFMRCRNDILSFSLSCRSFYLSWSQSVYAPRPHYIDIT